MKQSEKIKSLLVELHVHIRAMNCDEWLHCLI